MTKAWTVTAISATLAITVGISSWGVLSTRQPPPSKSGNVLSRLPIAFEPNRGQTDPRVKYLARGNGLRLFLTRDEAVIAMQRRVGDERSWRTGTNRLIEEAVVRMRLQGANEQAAIEAHQQLPGRINYLLGRDSSKWQRGLPTFAEVSYRDIYPGVDLIYHSSKEGRLEYDFVVAPRANPGSIKLNIAGADRLSITADGDLAMALGDAELIEHRPVAYQTIDGNRRPIGASYVLNGSEVGIRLGAYDASRKLVIDPQIIYESYLGGADADSATGVAEDSSGNIIVAGSTSSKDFPTTSGVFQKNLSGTTDAFVSKIGANGGALLFSTFLGGGTTTQALGLAVDQNGVPTVVGTTSSDDFPVTAGAIQLDLNGPSDGFISQINPDNGSSLLFSTYLGGSNTESVNGVAVDAASNLYVGGVTASNNFPVTAGSFQPTTGGASSDGFIAKINPGAASLVYSTYLGGLGSDAVNGIAVDSSGNAYVTGSTTSENFPVSSGAFQTTLKGTQNAFVTQLNAAGSATIFSSYLGGNATDLGSGIALSTNSPPTIAVTGTTNSSDFPTQTPNQAAIGGQNDAFVTEMPNAGDSLLYSSFLGGAKDDSGAAIAFVGTEDKVAVTGSTKSTNFPIKAAVQGGLVGSPDAFLTVVNIPVSKLSSSTYFGSSGGTSGSAISISSDGKVALFAGSTSANFLSTTTNAVQPAYGGGSSDAFIVEISFVLSAPNSESSSGPGLTTTSIALALIALWITIVMIRRRHAEA